MLKLFFYLFFLVFQFKTLEAQIPVEVFAGHRQLSFDLMFFKFFKNGKKQPSPWLFFNRNRASLDYRMTQTEHLPRFGFTEAVSYHHKKLRGFAPVLVAQILNTGFYGKLGLQYAFLNQNWTYFTWLVVGLESKFNLDYFMLLRYSPKLKGQLKLFTQIESFNQGKFGQAELGLSLVQRLRLGLGFKEHYQFGLGLDLSQNKGTIWIYTQNLGGFLRTEF